MVQPHTESARLLVVDDEKVIREILSEFLTMEGYLVRSVEDGQAAIDELKLRPYDMVISDLKMPKLSGLQLLEKIVEANINVLTVIMTGFGTVETAIEAMKKGAYDYILKPFKVEEVIHVVQRGLDRQRLQAENMRLSEALTLYKISEAIATSLDIEHVLDVILRAVVDEVDADVASLHLADPETGRYEERIKVANPGANTRQSASSADGDVASGEIGRPGPEGVPAPNMEELLGLFNKGKPILAHGVKTNKFVDTRGEHTRLVSYSAVPLQIATRIIGVLNVYSFTRGKRFDEGHRKMLSVLASRAATAIDNARLYDDLLIKNTELQRANLSLEENFRQTVAGFAQALEESDLYTRGHSERVAMYAEIIARALGLPDDEVERVVQAGLMHDIGKIGIRYDMLNKPGKLTPEEVKVFRDHPDKGKRIMHPIPCMRNLIDGAWCHHEWYDGGGYPRGLMGDRIPLVGRIVAIADAYDAMTSDRAYRRALPHATAVNEMNRCAGSQFDPSISEVFLRHLEKFRAEAREKGELSLVPR